MVIEAYVFALFRSFLISMLILTFSYALIMKIFSNEHAHFYAVNRAYQISTISGRALHILLNGRLISRIVLIISCAGLYHGALFLGNDLKIAWELYYMILTK